MQKIKKKLEFSILSCDLRPIQYFVKELSVYPLLKMEQVGITREGFNSCDIGSWVRFLFSFDLVILMC
jgi:hypothetical protein